jgi:hypothetical protein
MMAKPTAAAESKPTFQSQTIRSSFDGTVLTAEVIQRGAQIEEEFGPDVEEALSRWEASGAQSKGIDSAPWLSVAFLFARQFRNYLR